MLTACKPGSVPPQREGDDHSSRASVTGRLCNLPGRRLGNSPVSVCLRRAAPIWFCLPVGLPCRRCCRRAVRSYRTLSPLPAVAKAAAAVFFLWHYPCRPRRVLPGTVFPWSPDFPLSIRRAAIRPSGGLEYRLIKNDAELKMTLNNLKPY